MSTMVSDPILTTLAACYQDETQQEDTSKLLSWQRNRSIEEFQKSWEAIVGRFNDIVPWSDRGHILDMESIGEAPSAPTRQTLVLGHHQVQVVTVESTITVEFYRTISYAASLVRRDSYSWTSFSQILGMWKSTSHTVVSSSQLGELLFLQLIQMEIQQRRKNISTQTKTQRRSWQRSSFLGKKI